MIEKPISLLEKIILFGGVLTVGLVGTIFTVNKCNEYIEAKKESIEAQKEAESATLRYEQLKEAQNYEKQGNIEKAIEFYEKVELFFKVANLYEEQGEIEKAIEFYEKDNWFLQAANLYEKQGNMEKAEELRAKADIN